MRILLATSNEHKAQSIQSILGRRVQQIHLELPEIQAIDVHAVIEEKARFAYQMMRQPVLVEDTSLSISVWNGLPGALIRWFLETVGNEGICRMMASYELREATAETCLGYFYDQEFFSFSGIIKGQITRSPRGDYGFGWDPIFVPAGWTKTIAEMTEEDQNEFLSMRKIAVLKLKEFLDDQVSV